MATYAVSYVHQSPNGKLIFGIIEIKSRERIKGFQDIQNITNIISEKHPNSIPLSFFLIEE